ncbi:MAG: hypothetical protein WCP17_03340 [bacterium]
MRLLDRILSEGLITYDSDETLQGNLERAQLVVIDNVTTYCYQVAQQQQGQPENDVKSSDFPNVMLPFETAFLEMRPRLQAHGGVFPDVYDEAGLLMRMYRIEEFMSGMSQDFTDVRTWQTENMPAGEEVAWLLTARLFLHDRVNRKSIHFANFTTAVNRDGRIVNVRQGGWVDTMLMDVRGITPQQQERFAAFFATFCLCPALMALSFMHCRNVGVRTEVPPVPLSRKHERKTGRPLLKYRVLQIDHMKQVLEREGRVSTEGLKRALHICRGHFATYGKDGKGLLFGKHAATVWIPMHTRGSVEEGVVVKDYDVK